MGFIPGNVLLSHKVTLAVPSALEGLTSVFGMGTGVAPPLQSPGNRLEYLPPAADRFGGTHHSCRRQRRRVATMHWVQNALRTKLCP